MKDSFQEVLSRRRDLLHRKAIWQEVAEHLSVFVDTDSTKAKHGIKCDTEEMVVPQGVIVSVSDYIADFYLADIEVQLKIIDSSEVANAEGNEDGKKGTKRKDRKAPRTKGRRRSQERHG